MIYLSSRRDFLKATSVLIPLALAGTSLETKRYSPKLSFSTLGCPDWTYEQILNFASANHYTGIEIRGLRRELDITRCPEFSTPENLLKSKSMAEEKALKFVNLGCSAEMHHADDIEKQKNLRQAKQFIDLAQQLACPYIRVFPNNLPKNQDHAKTLETISNNLRELGDYARDSKVIVLMETHGDVVYSDDIQRIMQAVEHPHVGLVWDIVNMWSVTKESPREVYPKLKEYIRHTHIKDLKLVDGKERYTLLGKGESPVFQAIDLLAKNNYKEYFSFEWEKMWHPEIEDPEIALADYPKAMMAHFS